MPNEKKENSFRTVAARIFYAMWLVIIFKKHKCEHATIKIHVNAMCVRASEQANEPNVFVCVYMFIVQCIFFTSSQPFQKP